jgi:hypothetical protein
MDFYGFNHAFSVQLFHSGFLIIDKMSPSLQDLKLSKADQAVPKYHSAYDGIDFCVLRNVLATVQLVGDVSVNRAEEETSTNEDENQRVNNFLLENPATDGIPPQVVDLTQEE